jgi:O-antigen/teichoic acid export membrane protein
MNNNKKKEISVVSNFLYNTVYQILRVILPLVTVPYVSRVLRAENLGIYNYTYSIALYFAMAAYLGFENYGNRLIAQNRDDENELNKSFSGAYYFQLMSSTVAIIAYIFFMSFFCKENQIVAWLQILYIASEMFNVSWVYFGLEQFKRTALINVVIRLMSFAAIFMFVKDQNDITVYTAICAGSILISSLALWCGLKRYVKFVKVSFEEIWNYGKGCLILFLPVFVINIYRSMDKIMLGNISTMTEVALYSNADKIVELPYGVIAALGVVMLPRMTNFVATGQKELSKKYLEVSMRFMMFMACGMAFGMMAVGRVFAPVFFGKEFTACGSLIMIMAPMVIVRACANVIRTQYLLPNKRDKDYIVSILIGVVINLVFNSLMIPVWNSGGAAIATLFAESFVAIYQMFVCRKNIPIINYTFRNWFFIVAGFIMFIPVYIYGNYHAASVITLIIQITMGVIIYLVVAGGYIAITEKEMLKKIIGGVLKYE